MPPLTLNQAAKACRKSKSTLLEAISSGRMSASRNSRSQWQIDPSELFRVYPPTEHLPVPENRYQPPGTGSEPLQVLLANEQRERERERAVLLDQIADLKTDRDHWRNQATMLLTQQKPETKPLEPVPEPPKTGQPTGSRLYDKLFGRK
jgi:hypothetical protein